MMKSYTLLAIGLCSGLLMTYAEAGDSAAKTAVGGAALGAGAAGALGRQLGK